MRNCTLASFSTDDLRSEIKKRASKSRASKSIMRSLILSEKDAKVVKMLKKEAHDLGAGIKCYIPIGKAKYEFLLYWNSDWTCNCSYTENFELTDKSIDSRILSNAMDEYINNYEEQIVLFSTVKKAMDKVNKRIKAICTTSDALAKKYGTDRMLFFDTYIVNH